MAIRKASRVVAAAALVWSGAGCVAGEVPAAPADDPVLVEGQAIYASNCANCHGAAGGGGAGSKLSGGAVVERFPDPGDQIRLVADGARAMPGFDEKLTEAELEAVVAYTRTVLADVD